MVELLMQRREGSLDVGEVHHPAGLLADVALDVHRDVERVAVKPRALVIGRDVRQPVSRLEGELLEDGDHGMPRYLCVCTLKPPSRMREAVLDGRGRVRVSVGPVHRLQEEVGEVEVLVALGLAALLAVDELQLVARGRPRPRPRPSGSCTPSRCRRARARVPLVSMAISKVTGVQRVDQRRVELQQRLAAGAHDETGRAGHERNVISQRVRVGEVPTTLAVGSDEVGVAEPAHARGAMLLASRPEVAAGEPAEDRGAAGVARLRLGASGTLPSRDSPSGVPRRIGDAGVGEALLAETARVALTARPTDRRWGRSN